MVTRDGAMGAGRLERPREERGSRSFAKTMVRGDGHLTTLPWYGVGEVIGDMK